MSVQSFSAVCDSETHTLILGSMPGVASLSAIEYYAHKRNAFWPIMIAMLKQCDISYPLASKLNYPERLALLSQHGFGLWDVLAECERDGSLDSAIVSESVVCNDFVGLLRQYPNIKHMAFNGKAAQKIFHRHVMPHLSQRDFHIEEIRLSNLPSSSPAMASLSLEEKFKRWEVELNGEVVVVW